MVLICRNCSLDDRYSRREFELLEKFGKIGYILKSLHSH